MSTASPTGGVLCSCVQGARQHVPNLPKGNAEDFEPNTTPARGVLVLFLYADGVHHIAYVDELSSEGFHVQHYNKKRCQHTEEWIGWNDSSIKGFYKP